MKQSEFSFTFMGHKGLVTASNVVIWNWISVPLSDAGVILRRAIESQRPKSPTVVLSDLESALLNKIATSPKNQGHGRPQSHHETQVWVADVILNRDDTTALTGLQRKEVVAYLHGIEPQDSYLQLSADGFVLWQQYIAARVSAEPELARYLVVEVQ